MNNIPKSIMIKDACMIKNVEELIKLNVNKTIIKEVIIKYAYDESTNHNTPIDMNLVDKLFERIKRNMK